MLNNNSNNKHDVRAVLINFTHFVINHVFIIIRLKHKQVFNKSVV